MTRPIAIHPARQYAEGDCGLAALSMLTGETYAKVRRVAETLVPHTSKNGATWRELLKISAALKHPLRKRRLADILSEDLEDATGVLLVEKKTGRTWHGHAVVLFCGVVLDPSDGLMWELDVYLTEGAWTLYYLLESPSV